MNRRILITDLGADSGVTVAKPFEADIEPSDGCFISSCVGFGTIATGGDSEEDAIYSLKCYVAHSFKTLVAMPDVKLGPHMKLQKQFLLERLALAVPA
jgi:hypothetical protein